jgi:hypothetical protein
MVLQIAHYSSGSSSFIPRQVHGIYSDQAIAELNLILFLVTLSHKEQLYRFRKVVKMETVRMVPKSK